MTTTLTTAPRQRLLIAEEDDATRAFLADNLHADGYDVATAANADGAARALDLYGPFDLVVADVNGSTVALLDRLRCGRAAAAASDTPLVALTAKTDDNNRRRLLEHGADDVVCKPFSYPELALRVRAILRRTFADPVRAVVIEAGPIRVDTRQHEATVAGRLLELNRKEFALLATMARDPERVWTKEELLGEVWGIRAGKTRTLDSHACRLRGFLADHGVQAIVNVWGVGYRLLPRDWQEAAPSVRQRTDGGG
jgi:DNA-binding response OmpR family regulator